jgi:hypothetical protein
LFRPTRKLTQRLGVGVQLVDSPARLSALATRTVAAAAARLVNQTAAAPLLLAALRCRMPLPRGGLRVQVRLSGREGVGLVGSHTGGWKRPCLQTAAASRRAASAGAARRRRLSGRERVDLVGSHGRWKRPCLQTDT